MYKRQLIHNVVACIIRHTVDLGEMDYFLTQFLAGQGSLYAYLSRMRKVEHPSCVFDGSAFDDAHDTFFDYDLWVWERRRFDSIIGVMLWSRTAWDELGQFCDRRSRHWTDP